MSTIECFDVDVPFTNGSCSVGSFAFEHLHNKSGDSGIPSFHSLRSVSETSELLLISFIISVSSIM